MRGKVLTFHIEDTLYGVPIHMVKEIDRDVEYTPVPGTPAFMVGLMNMRGQIVTLFDLANLINGSRAPKGKKTSCMILRNSVQDPDYVGLIIDRAGAVVDIEEDMCEPCPANMDMADQEFITEIVKLNDQLLLIIDPYRVCAEMEQYTN